MLRELFSLGFFLLNFILRVLFHIVPGVSREGVEAHHFVTSILRKIIFVSPFIGGFPVCSVAAHDKWTVLAQEVVKELL